MSSNYPAKQGTPGEGGPPRMEPIPAPPPTTMHSSWTVFKGVGLLIVGAISLIILAVYLFRHLDFFPK